MLFHPSSYKYDVENWFYCLSFYLNVKTSISWSCKDNFTIIFYIDAVHCHTNNCVSFTSPIQKSICRWELILQSISSFEYEYIYHWITLVKLTIWFYIYVPRSGYYLVVKCHSTDPIAIMSFITDTSVVHSFGMWIVTSVHNAKCNWLL
jgi:hypothetical protein